MSRTTDYRQTLDSKGKTTSQEHRNHNITEIMFTVWGRNWIVQVSVWLNVALVHGCNRLLFVMETQWLRYCATEWLSSFEYYLKYYETIRVSYLHATALFYRLLHLHTSTNLHIYILHFNKIFKSVKYSAKLECLWVKKWYLSPIELWRYILQSVAICCRINILFAWSHNQNFAITCGKYFQLTSSVLLLLKASWLYRIEWWCITWKRKCFLILLLTYLLTYLYTSCSKVLLEKLTESAASQEFPRFLWNPKVHYITHKCPPPVPILRQLHPVPATPFHILKFRINIILPPMSWSPHFSLSLRFPHQNPVRHSSLPTMRHMPRPSHSSRFYHPNNIG